MELKEYFRAVHLLWTHNTW